MSYRTAMHSSPAGSSVPGSVYTLHVYLLLTTTLQGEYCHYPHFTDEETEAQRSPIANKLSQNLAVSS